MADWYVAPVAKACYNSAKRKYGNAVYFLGYVGNLNHQGSYSGHNPGYWAEANRYPQYGPYDGRAVLAVDIGVGSNTAVGNAIVQSLLKDERVLYVIYRGQGYRPNWRGGARFASSGHDTHVHVSFVQSATHDRRPFFGRLRKVFNIEGLEIPKMKKRTLAKWFHDSRKWAATVVEAAKVEIIKELRANRREIKALREELKNR